MTEETNDVVGEIKIVVTEEDISYDSNLDIANILLFLELTKAIILKQSLEKN